MPFSSNARLGTGSFLAENGANLRKVSFGMFPYTVSVHVVTLRAQYIRHRLQHTCSVSTMIVNRTKEHLSSLLERRHSLNNLKRELKIA